jgi:4,5-DOPA dioxygenase extradiol
MAVPTLFTSHGSPRIALDPGAYGAALADWARAQPPPRAVLVVSAHFEADGEWVLTGSSRPPTIHDFGGFDPKLYTLRYPAPGDPVLAEAVAAELRAHGHPARVDSERGLDHGAWMPLRFLLPEASVPVVQLSLPGTGGVEQLAAVGSRLRRFRDEGVWIVGSGGLVHNFRTLVWDDRDAPVQPWAVEAEEGLLSFVRRKDLAGAAADVASGRMALAAPTPEHLAPAFVVLGAAGPRDAYRDVYRGFQHGSLSMRTFAFEEGATSV